MNLYLITGQQHYLNMKTEDRAIEKLKIRRNRILAGLINCIPLPFPRLRAWLPGIERKRYVIITANQKVKLYLV